MLSVFLFASRLAIVFAVLYTVHSQADVPPGTDIRGTNTTGTNTGTRVVPTLEFVITVTRHGKRSPVITFPASEYPSQNTTFWPYGAGELTQNGRMEMYGLGEKVRSMYDGFLDQIYHKEDFQASSSLVSRSLESAELFLAGLFPPKGFQIWNEQLPWQPVPVFPNILDPVEKLLFWNHLCPALKKARMETLMAFDQLNNDSLTEMIDYALPYTGYNESDVEHFGPFYKEEILIILWESLGYLTDNGYTVPEWANEIYPEPLTSMIPKFSWTIGAGSPIQAEYSEGALFRAMVEMMEMKAKKVSCSPNRMMYFSGHDSTLLVLLSILGQPPMYVNPGSAMFFELHRHPNSDGFHVQVVFHDGGSPDLEPAVVNIPGCDAPCHLAQLMNITEKYYNVSGWQHECRNTLVDY